METVFAFGDDLNDLNQLEMQVSFEDIELRVRFSNADQLTTWKFAIQDTLRKIQTTAVQHKKTVSQVPIADENVESDRILEDISLEKSNEKPLQFKKFDTKSKAKLEKEFLLRENRLMITRALQSSILSRRNSDGLPAVDGQNKQINSLAVAASGSC